MSASADDRYEQENDGGDVPNVTGGAGDKDYEMRAGEKGGPIPVQSDNVKVEDPIDPATADSDATLARDEKDAIDTDNIIDERTRGAKPTGTYKEPGDEEGIEGNDGRSRVAGGPNPA